MTTAPVLPADFKVETVPAQALGASERARWVELRNQNPSLWSPFFDLRLFDHLTEHVPNPHVAIVHYNGTIEAFLPFQGKINGYGRPLGAPLADQHGLIQSGALGLDFCAVAEAIGLTGFSASGVVGPMRADMHDVETHICHVADVSMGADAYRASRKALFSDHVKKSKRRQARGERELGPMRLNVVDRDQGVLDTVVAWKRRKFAETNRHDILAGGWVLDLIHSLYQTGDPDFVAEVTTLHFGDTLVALEYGLRSGPVLHSWLPSFDRQYSHLSPGVLLMDGMIELAAERGLEKVDLGAGHDDYKRHASNMSHTLNAGQLRFSAVRKLIGAGINLSESLLGLTKSDKLVQIPRRLARRSEMILSVEPDLKGRLAGFATALKALG